MSKSNIENKRLVINKYTDVSSAITKEIFNSYGEFIISIEPGKEGVYVKNANDEKVKVGVNENEISYLFEEALKKLHFPKQISLSVSEYEKLVEEDKIESDTYYMIFEDDVYIEPDFSQDEIILENDYNPSETIIINQGDKTLNLNNKKITAPIFIDNSDNSINSYGIWVKGGNLTIEGEGEIIAQDANYSMAVWANGGNIVINNGTFKNAGESCDLIYASNGGKIIINGGDFFATPKGSEAGTGNDYSALNIKNSDREISKIEVRGGRFYKFNPANNVSEGQNTNFVAEGYKSIQEGDFWVVLPE